MPKVKVARKSTLVDMTPMCDVAFLLLLFFMLTTKFKPQEPVEVVTPSSISATLLPESHVAMVLISKDGKVYFGMDDQNERLKLIEAFNKSYKLGLSPQAMKNYSLASVVGMPLKGLKQFLNIPKDKEAGFNQPGIPVDSADQELGQWIRYARNVSSSPRQLKYVIKADDGTKYDIVSKVLKIFKDESIHKLHLITSMKSIPPGTPAFQTEQANKKSSSK